MLYERGAFDAQTTQFTAAALAAFTIGLPSFVLQKVFQPVYFARFNMRAPMWFAMVSAITNIIGSLLLFPTYGHVGIAIATSIAGWVNAVLLILGLMRSGNFGLSRETSIRLMKIVISSLAMGIVLYAASNTIVELIEGRGFLIKFPIVFLAVSGGAIAYFGCLMAVGGLDLGLIKAGFRKKP